MGLCWPILGLCLPILRAMWAHVGAMLGGGPSLLRRGETCRTAMPRPGCPWPDSSAYVRQPARGPTMWAHFVAMLAYVGLCWPIAAYLGAMLAHLGAMLAYLEGNVGPSLGYVGPSWGYVGPSWGYVGLSWGLCWPILGLCSPILKPIWAHVDLS